MSSNRWWYYAKEGQDQEGPVLERRLLELIESGEVKGSDLVWSEGMPEWKPARQALKAEAGRDGAVTAETAPATFESVSTDSGRVAVPAKLAGWSTFLGISAIIMGVFGCLSCVGVVYGIPMIIAGIALQAAGTELKKIHDIEASLSPFFGHLNKAASVMGIAMIIVWVFSALMMLAYVLIFVAAFAAS